jgi:hypothetical protein
VVEVSLASGALAEVGNDAHGEGVAAGGGEEFTKQVSRSVEVAGACGSHDFDVVAFPVRWAADDGMRRSASGLVDRQDPYR